MTIRVRLALIYVGAIVVTIGLVGALVWWQLGSALRTSLDQTLQTRAAAVVSGLENNGQSGLQEGDATGAAGVFVAIFDAQARMIDSSPGIPPGLVPPATGVVSADLALGTSTYAVHAITAQGGVRVVAGSSLSGIKGTLDQLTGSLVLVGLIASVASLVGGWLIAGRALRPVNMITGICAIAGFGSARSRLSASAPSIPGILKSSNSAAGCV